jgi:hypothetical protein
MTPDACARHSLAQLASALARTGPHAALATGRETFRIVALCACVIAQVSLAPGQVPSSSGWVSRPPLQASALLRRLVPAVALRRAVRVGHTRWPVTPSSATQSMGAQALAVRALTQQASVTRARVVCRRALQQSPRLLGIATEHAVTTLVRVFF